MAVCHPVCCCLSCCCLPTAGTHAARPLPDSTSHTSRQLLKSPSGALSCHGLHDIRFGDSYQALALPTHKLIIGRVQLHNSGKHPFGVKSTGFKLSGRRGPLHGSLRCPRNVIDPGSMLQVGALTCSAVTCCDML